MTEFTPVASLAGGALIGLAAVILLAFNGRIAGVSGILFRLLPPYADGETPSRAAFIAGLVAAPLIMGAVTGAPILQTVSGNLPLMAVAGLLVGFGSAWGAGCTSGHGVCGLSRLSARSIAATLTFMATGVATVFLVRHVLAG
jgi:hypothetical protein